MFFVNSQAEKVAAQMITEKRMDGYVDQLESIVYFASNISFPIFITIISLVKSKLHFSYRQPDKVGRSN